MVKAKIRKIGNSLGIILPKDILTMMGLDNGDDIEISNKTDEVLLTIRKKKR